MADEFKEKRLWMLANAVALLACCTLAAVASGLPRWASFTCEGTNYTLGLYSVCEVNDFNCVFFLEDMSAYPVWYHSWFSMHLIGLACLGITSLLTLCYSFLPSLVYSEVNMALAGCTLMAGVFLMVGVFNLQAGGGRLCTLLRYLDPTPQQYAFHTCFFLIYSAISILAFLSITGFIYGLIDRGHVIRVKHAKHSDKLTKDVTSEAATSGEQMKAIAYSASLLGVMSRKRRVVYNNNPPDDSWSDCSLASED